MFVLHVRYKTLSIVLKIKDLCNSLLHWETRFTPQPFTNTVSDTPCQTFVTKCSRNKMCPEISIDLISKLPDRLSIRRQIDGPGKIQ